MKMKFDIAVAFLSLALLSGCVWERMPADPDFPANECTAVSFKLCFPFSSCPLTRAISDDSSIHDYTVWVFEQDVFQKWEKLKKDGDTYSYDSGDEDLAITYDGTNGGKMTIQLDRQWTAVKLMMVANCTVTAPATGTTWADAEASLQGQTFTCNGTQTDMPMYGTSDTPFAVKQGAEGVIQLKRCMAKVVVDASTAADHFKLEGIAVHQVNTSGTVAPKSEITNADPLAESISGTVDDATNTGTVYLPEIAGIKDASKTDGTTTTFVLIKGQYTNKQGETATKYYRFDFIERRTEGGIAYAALDTLKRNHAYIFDIKYLIEGVGKTDEQAALLPPAANIIGEGQMVTVKITDEQIMDITTDNYIYLGVTAGHIDAVLNTDGTHYAAQIHVITNNPDGWKMDALPTGVIAIPNEYTPPSGTDPTVQSVWVYFPKAAYHPGGEETLYIYSGNIRKSVVVKIPPDSSGGA